jgi:hypothetical protein
MTGRTIIAGLTRRGGIGQAGTARELDLPDPRDALRRVDLAGGLDLGRALAHEAIGSIGEALPVVRIERRTQPSRARRWAIIGLAIGLAAVALAMVARQAGRRAMSSSMERWQHDREAVDAAANEGMGTAIGARDAALEATRRVPVAMEMSGPDEGVGADVRSAPDELAEPLAARSTGEAVDQERVGRTAIGQATTGIGLPRV